MTMFFFCTAVAFGTAIASAAVAGDTALAWHIGALAVSLTALVFIFAATRKPAADRNRGGR